MGQTGTVLSPVLRDDCWRVRIAWSNGSINHVGRFASEWEAIEWINAHPRLTVQVEQQEEIRGRGRPAKNNVTIEDRPKRGKANKKAPVE
jgi:hypothetical protein